MKQRNFTGPNINFSGGFSGGSATESRGILWDLNTYKFRGQFQASGETSPTGIWFKPDGTKLFVVGFSTDRIRSWDLTIPWDVTSATNPVAMAGVLLNTVGGAIGGTPTGVSFSNDGLYAFVTEQVNSVLFRYSLSTPWDLTTLNSTADQSNTSIYTSNLSPQSIWVRDDGLMFTTANSGTNVTVRVFTTTIANDITTLTLSDTGGASGTPVGAVWVDNGNKLLWVQQSTDIALVNSYANPYTFDSPVTVSQRTMTTQDTTPQDVYMPNDGTRFYYLGSASDSIYQFTLD